MKYRRLTLVCILLAVIFVGVSAYLGLDHGVSEVQTIQNESVRNAENVEAEVVTMAKEWLEANYGQLYTLRNVNAKLVRTFETDTEICYTIAMGCETKYKFTKVDEIPFVKGILDQVETKSLSSAQRAAVKDVISEIEADALLGEFTDLAVDVVVAIDKTNTDKAAWKMYYQDGIDTTLHDIDGLALNEEELYNSGREAAAEILSGASGNEP